MLWHIDSQRDGRVGHDALSNLIIVLRAKLPILEKRGEFLSNYWEKIQDIQLMDLAISNKSHS